VFFTACGNRQQLALSGTSPIYAPLDTNQTLTRIAFGSCNQQRVKQRLWDPILSNDPNIWIWLGDNIYGNTKDMAVMKEKYDRQNRNKEYRKLLAKVPIIGTWDDHDYGANNKGKKYAKKKESLQLSLDFLNVPADSPRRMREGNYSSYTFGKGAQQVKIILLDSRYFRDSSKKGTGTILGKAQWKWLEKELKNSQAAIHIIGNGIQIIPNEHSFEKWGNFPKERERLFELIKDTGIQNPILLSGDRHVAEISKLIPEGGTQPIYEVTSSGLTHYLFLKTTEKNKHRVGNMISNLNFGLIEIDWNTQPIEMKLQIRGPKNALLQEHKIQ